VEALREGLTLMQPLGGKWEIYALLWTFAEVAQISGEPARAVRLYLAAEQIAQSIGAWMQGDTADLQQHLAACRLALDESEYAAAVEEGSSMSRDQAIACALEGEAPGKLGGK
ncbi:MAG: hypothetical protein ACM3QS_13985, partial [Bacteroidota bacterium]